MAMITLQKSLVSFFWKKILIETIYTTKKISIIPKDSSKDWLKIYTRISQFDSKKKKSNFNKSKKSIQKHFMKDKKKKI